LVDIISFDYYYSNRRLSINTCFVRTEKIVTTEKTKY